MSWGRSRKPAAASPAELRAALEAERQRAALLEAVLASVDSAVVATDAAGHRLFSNPAAERLLPSLPRLPQLLQWIQRVAAGPHGGDSEAGEDSDAGERALASRLELPDERTLQVYITRLERPPLPAGCVVVARDISAITRLETARRDFIAALSHELRTPLTSIQGYAELLQRGGELPEATRAEYLETVAQNAARLARLARDLTTLSAVETGTYPFHFEALEASGLAAPALAVLAPLARERGARLGLGTFGPGRIRADRDALHRVLLNLIENALAHGGDGVEVSLDGAAAEGQYVFRVRDNGPGIGSSDQPRIFERFYRVAPGRSARGTGLGLALAKHIVLEHGGQIRVESALGEGSTFLVSLPLQAAEGQA